jgi:DNA-binding IscR family transcriptional regulator
MKKVTTPALAEFIAELTNLPPSVLRTITRRLREAGHLSQAGHGRGAAAATPYDAACILLVAMAELTPVHSAVVAEQIGACRPSYEFAAKQKIKVADQRRIAELKREFEAFMRGVDIPQTPFALIAYLIDNPSFVKKFPFQEISVDRRDGITVALGNVRLYGREIAYFADPLKIFSDKFGRPSINRSHSLAVSVLLQISTFLGIEDSDVEESEVT